MMDRPPPPVPFHRGPPGSPYHGPPPPFREAPPYSGARPSSYHDHGFRPPGASLELPAYPPGPMQMEGPGYPPRGPMPPGPRPPNSPPPPGAVPGPPGTPARRVVPPLFPIGNESLYRHSFSRVVLLDDCPKPLELCTSEQHVSIFWRIQLLTNMPCWFAVLQGRPWGPSRQARGSSGSTRAPGPRRLTSTAIGRTCRRRRAPAAVQPPGGIPAAAAWRGRAITARTLAVRA